MVFLGNLEKTEKGIRSSFQHYMPFDPVYGLGKTREELELEGVFVESVPEPLNNGKIPILYLDDTKTAVFYDYE